MLAAHHFRDEPNSNNQIVKIDRGLVKFSRKLIVLREAFAEYAHGRFRLIRKRQVEATNTWH